MTYKLLISFLQVRQAVLKSSMGRIRPPGDSLPTPVLGYTFVMLLTIICVEFIFHMH